MKLQKFTGPLPNSGRDVLAFSITPTALGCSAWKNVAYSNFQATSLEWFQEATVLRFVTVISDARFFVSGCAVAIGPTYHHPVNVIEHVRPEYVAQFTGKLDALGLKYSVLDEP